MEELTGLAGFDWALVLLYAFAGVLAAGAWMWRVPGSRLLGGLAVPIVAGAATIAAILPLYWSETAHVIDRAKAPAVAAAAVACFFAVTAADFLVSRVAAAVRRALASWRSRRTPDAALVAAVAVPAMLAILALLALDERTTSAYERSRIDPRTGLAIRGDFELPGQPVGLALRTASDGYISLANGEIAKFSLPPAGDDLELTSVAHGLQNPRGIAFADDTLYVAELGPLPCGDALKCKGEDVDAASPDNGEVRILRHSRARLLAYDAPADGALTRNRVLLDELPVVNSEHGVNSVLKGDDGRLYVPIGNLDRLYRISLSRDVRSRPNFDLLGTVLSLEPDGTDVDVVARGLRNVYELAVDSAGRLYGVDNDGPTRSGTRNEEVLRINAGGDYGYPADGTFAPYTRRTVPPLWTVDTGGSAGLEVVTSEGALTLVIGSCGDVYAVRLSQGPGPVTVDSEQPVEHLLSLSGCVTGIESLGESRLAMTLYTFAGPPRLLVVDLG